MSMNDCLDLAVTLGLCVHVLWMAWSMRRLRPLIDRIMAHTGRKVVVDAAIKSVPVVAFAVLSVYVIALSRTVDLLVRHGASGASLWFFVALVLVCICGVTVQRLTYGRLIYHARELGALS